jgi:hypothetical protein
VRRSTPAGHAPHTRDYLSSFEKSWVELSVYYGASPTNGTLWLELGSELPLLIPHPVFHWSFFALASVEMSPHEKRDASGVSQTERPKSPTELREVQNVALADATAKAGVSPWTPSMFKVSSDDLLQHAYFAASCRPEEGESRLRRSLQQQYRWEQD